MRKTYPRVYDIRRLTYWVNLLFSYGIPLTMIENRNLKKWNDEGRISSQRLWEVYNWKEEHGIQLADESEYRIFLKDLGIVKTRAIDPEVDVCVPLGGDGPLLPDLFGNQIPRGAVYYLSEIGEKLRKFVEKGDQVSFDLYVFWLLLRCERYPQFLQDAICHPMAYHGGDFDDLIPSNDKVSRNCVLQWGKYFGYLRSLDGGYALSTRSLSFLLSSSSVCELNKTIREEGGNLTLYVDEIVDTLSAAFRINPTAVNFTMIADMIFSNCPRPIVVGSTTGRNDSGLPNNPRIQMLTFNKVIPLDILKEVSVSDFHRVLRYVRQPNE